MAGLLPNIDPEGLLEYSVVFTDRAVNQMSLGKQDFSVGIEAPGLLENRALGENRALFASPRSFIVSVSGRLRVEKCRRNRI